MSTEIVGSHQQCQLSITFFVHKLVAKLVALSADSLKCFASGVIDNQWCVHTE